MRSTTGWGKKRKITQETIGLKEREPRIYLHTNQNAKKHPYAIGGEKTPKYGAKQQENQTARGCSGKQQRKVWSIKGGRTGSVWLHPRNDAPTGNGWSGVGRGGGVGDYNKR